LTRNDSCVRILLAEDDPACRKVALIMLQRLGYKTDAVNNGQEVLQALKRHMYDLVLMDILMPEMDGIEATREIRRSYPASELPKIVAFTAYDHPDVRKKCIEAGMDDYISKPVKKEELKTILVKYSGESASKAVYVKPVRESHLTHHVRPQTRPGS
jgi:CheY-like chemotaxis protein